MIECESGLLELIVGVAIGIMFSAMVYKTFKE